MAEHAVGLNADVVIIGGGIAGLAAACAVADAGRNVVLIEAAPRLGGRASSFDDRVTGERVDNGQHVLFGCYRETYAFLRQIGTDHLAPLDRTLAVRMIGMDGTSRRLRCPAIAPPWHLVMGVLSWPGMPLRDRLSVLRLGAALRKAAPVANAGETVSQWLRRHGQSEAVCHWLWNPLAVAALNQSPDNAAAAAFAHVLAELFGPRVEDSAIGLPVVPLDELFGLPAERYVVERGGAVLKGVAAKITLDNAGRVTGVLAGGDLISTRVVICAVPWHALAGVWRDEVPDALAALVATSARMDPSPIVTVNLWFSRAVLPDRFVGLVGGSMNWAFDKRALLGDDARHVSVVAGGADDLVAMTNDEVTALAVSDLSRALPDVRGARLERSVVVRERRATFSVAPGQPSRPATVTPLDGFLLAGDWTDTGLPATIEGAVRSGRRAAAAIVG